MKQNKKPYVLKNGNIIDVNNDTILIGYSILINNGRIEKIQKGDIEGNYKTIDCTNKFISPGLINMHVHLFGSGKPSNATTGKGKSQAKLLKFVQTGLGKKILHLISNSCAKTELLSGVTTLRSVGDINYTDIYTRNKINEGKMKGPRMLCSGFALTSPNGHGVGTIARGFDNKESYINQLNENISQGIDWVKICVTGGVMDCKVVGEPGEVKMTLEETSWIVDAAHEKGFKVASHTESSEGVKICVKTGVDTIEHGAIMDDETINLIKEKGLAVVITLSPALPTVQLPQEFTHYNDNQLINCKVIANSFVECAKQSLENDIKTGLGTDAACPFSLQYGMPQELYYLVKYAGYTNQKALKIATIKNAELLDMDNLIGSIEEGKFADIIIMNNNPYDDIKALKNLNYVIHNGVIEKNPKFKHLKKVDKALATL